jgi:YHS domain-containing protein
MAEHRDVAPNEDPVCGMTVDIESARQKGLVTTYDGREYAFCGKGCFLEFRDDPEGHLKPDYMPAM